MMMELMVKEYVESLEVMLADVKGQMNDEMFRLLEVVAMDDADRLMTGRDDNGETLEERWALEDMLETADLPEELEKVVRNFL